MSWLIILTILEPILVTCFLIYLTFQNKLERTTIESLLTKQQQDSQEQRIRFDEHQIKSLKLIQDSLQQALAEIRKQFTNSFNQHIQELNNRMDKLTHQTQEKLQEIRGEVDKQLTIGFEKTTATFTDIVKRLAIIDQAQKTITDLSTNIINLQDLLNDKRSRGTFGEVQLSSLIRNTIPESNFSMQYTLSNGKRVDCLLFLPKPTGNIAIDAKFPLETYQQLMRSNISDIERRTYEQQLRTDIKKHIHDISKKYIIPGETSEGAIMFIPAEAVFSEIHSHYPDLIETAYQSRVWLASPTTLMAILTTARAVIKDEATRKQIHIIQKHLITLSKDFGRFQKRMDNLAKHIGQAHEDIEEVHQSSKKISSRFDKIEKVELCEFFEQSTSALDTIE